MLKCMYSITSYNIMYSTLDILYIMYIMYMIYLKQCLLKPNYLEKTHILTIITKENKVWETNSESKSKVKFSSYKILRQ